MLWFRDSNTHASAAQCAPDEAADTVTAASGGMLHAADALPHAPSHAAAPLSLAGSRTGTPDVPEAGSNTIEPSSMPASREPMASEPDKPAAPERRAVGRSRTGGVALALGGGVARGWAHIGVLKAVDDFGLPISMIAGTSIGALVGGCYLAGKLTELEEFALSLTRTNIVRYLDFSIRGSGLMSGSKLARRLEEHMSAVSIEDMDRPFVAVATDIQSGHEIWLHDGPLVPALRASYALPGVFTPVIHGGRQLVDGAIVNPVPVSVCRAFEPDIVLAVNLNTEAIGRGTVIRASHYESMEKAMSAKAGAAQSWFPSFLHGREKDTATQNRLGVTAVMVEAFNIIQDRIARARLAGDPPDYTIRPKLRDVGLIDFHKAEQAIRLGYDEMTSRLRELENQGVFAAYSAAPARTSQTA